MDPNTQTQPILTVDQPTTYPPQKQKSAMEKIWRVIFALVLSIGFLSLIYYFLAQPFQIKGRNPVEPFKVNQYALTERVSFLFREPKVGDAVIFNKESNGNFALAYFGIITKIDKQDNLKIYSVISSKDNPNPDQITRDKIFARIYYPPVTANHISLISTRITPTPTLVADPTANWKTYTNTVHQITFKYPPTWNINTKDDSAELNAYLELSKDQVKIAMHFKLDGIGGSGRDYQGEPFNFVGLNLYKYQVEAGNDSIYKNSQAVGITDSLTNSLGFFTYEKYPYSIVLTYPNSFVGTTDETNIKTEFDQILSTFKFIDQATPVSTQSASPS